jgi:hypothetical protein
MDSEPHVNTKIDGQPTIPHSLSGLFSMPSLVSWRAPIICSLVFRVMERRLEYGFASRQPDEACNKS